MLRAIVFDFDGVIANSEPLHFQAFREVLRPAGIELTRHAYYDRYLGYDDIGVFNAVASDHQVSWSLERVSEFVALKAERMEALEADGSILFPGAESAIRAAAAALPIAIASGALGEEIRRILNRTGLRSCFKAIVAAEDTPVSKPAPDPYLRAVELLNQISGSAFSPHEIAALEDSPWGLQSARDAGLRTVGVAQTYAPEALEADLVITSMTDFSLEALARLCT